MTDAKPYPKAQQLGRGARRYRRKVASPKQWQAIIAAKGTTCRIADLEPDEHYYPIQYHHFVPRDLGGDDTADNIIPLCMECHRMVTELSEPFPELLALRLTDAEYAYAVDKAGEAVFKRVYGITYGR